MRRRGQHFRFACIPNTPNRARARQLDREGDKWAANLCERKSRTWRAEWDAQAIAQHDTKTDTDTLDYNGSCCYCCMLCTTPADAVGGAGAVGGAVSGRMLCAAAKRYHLSLCTAH